MRIPIFMNSAEGAVCRARMRRRRKMAAQRIRRTIASAPTIPPAMAPVFVLLSLLPWLSPLPCGACPVTIADAGYDTELWAYPIVGGLVRKVSDPTGGASDGSASVVAFDTAVRGSVYTPASDESISDADDGESVTCGTIMTLLYKDVSGSTGFGLVFPGSALESIAVGS